MERTTMLSKTELFSNLCVDKELLPKMFLSWRKKRKQENRKKQKEKEEKRKHEHNRKTRKDECE